MATKTLLELTHEELRPHAGDFPDSYIPMDMQERCDQEILRRIRDSQVLQGLLGVQDIQYLTLYKEVPAEAEEAIRETIRRGIAAMLANHFGVTQTGDDNAKN